MPSTEAPTWWADVQQEREDLTGGRRPAEDWLGEEIDFVPRRRRIAPRQEEAPALARAEHDLHGVFVPTATTTPAAAPAALERAGLDPDVAQELTHLRAADDPFASPPPPAGARRTVQIKGRPGESAAAFVSTARRNRPRTASDRVGHRPDRVALWAVVLGALLIVLAATSSSSQAATLPHRAATAPRAHVVHVAPHAPSRATHLRAVHR